MENKSFEDYFYRQQRIVSKWVLRVTSGIMNLNDHCSEMMQIYYSSISNTYLTKHFPCASLVKISQYYPDIFFLRSGNNKIINWASQFRSFHYFCWRLRRRLAIYNRTIKIIRHQGKVYRIDAPVKLWERCQMNFIRVIFEAIASKLKKLGPMFF